MEETQAVFLSLSSLLFHEQGLASILKAGFFKLPDGKEEGMEKGARRLLYRDRHVLITEKRPEQLSCPGLIGDTSSVEGQAT